MIGEFLEFLGISFGFPFFDFQPLKAWHSLHLGTERYMTKPGGARFSCMRPTDPSRNFSIWPPFPRWLPKITPILELTKIKSFFPRYFTSSGDFRCWGVYSTSSKNGVPCQDGCQRHGKSSIFYILVTNRQRSMQDS